MRLIRNRVHIKAVCRARMGYIRDVGESKTNTVK